MATIATACVAVLFTTTHDLTTTLCVGCGTEVQWNALVCVTGCQYGSAFAVPPPSTRNEPIKADAIAEIFKERITNPLSIHCVKSVDSGPQST